LVYDEFKKWLVQMDMERPPYIQTKEGVFHRALLYYYFIEKKLSSIRK
jgi:hypothetical protein